MTSDEAFAKITVILAPHLADIDYRKHGNPMPAIRDILEQLEKTSQETAINKVIK